jgi:predicted DNA-binding transcriptional regulator YafY
MKIDRLLGIIMIMLNRKRVTAKELSNMFEVSLRTIQRDIEAIEMAGIPIVSFQGYEGGYGILDNYKINSSFLNDKEFSILLNALQGVYKAYEDNNKKT